MRREGWVKKSWFAFSFYNFKLFFGQSVEFIHHPVNLFFVFLELYLLGRVMKRSPSIWKFISGRLRRFGRALPRQRPEILRLRRKCRLFLPD